MDTLLQDVRYALRQLGRSRGFTAVAVVTLALGIGANTAIFSAIDAVLLKPLPYRDAERILTLWQHDRNAGVERGEVAPGTFLDWRERSRSFEALAAIHPYSLDYLAPDGPESIRTWQVSEEFFRILGVSAHLGRTLLPEEFDAGSPAVVVLSHRLWQSRFGGDPAVVGRTLVLDQQPTTVVGVLPPGFDFPAGRDLWAPKRFDERERQLRGPGWYQVIGRLKPGVSVEAAQAELDGIAAQLALEHPRTNAEIGVTVIPLPEQLVRDVRPALLLLLGAVGLVLLIACVNVANLLLARAADRRREFAIRAVLGASRGRVIRQLVTESLLLAGFAGLAGLLVAAWGLSTLQAMSAAGLPHVETLGIDGRVVVFALVLALATTLLFGLAPALHAARADLRARLHSATHAATPAARRFRGALVTAELALAMVLLIGSGLLVRSLVALLQVERGYRTENVLAVTVHAWQYYPSATQRATFVDQMIERIGALPGVQAAGVTSSLPLADGIWADQARFSLDGHPAPEPGQEPTAHAAVVTSGYFQTLGIPLRGGRLFEPADHADAPRVVLVNDALARRYWPGEDPVGKRITLRFAGPAVAAEVVGVVADVRHAGLDEEPRPSLFVPHAQLPTGSFTFTVRTVGDPATLTRALQDELWAMSPLMPVASTATLEGLLADSLRERRFNLLLLLAFSLTALALAAVGTYGLLSYESRRRSHEIGVRIALGAGRGRVLRLVVGEGLRLSLTGVGVGALLALATTRLLSGFLFGVGPLDPLTFVGIALLLLAVSAIASYLPARRATRVDPMIALRSE